MFEFHRFDTALGAEIIGLDLSRAMDAKTVGALRRALQEANGLLIFRSQFITPQQHVAFSRRFGPLMIHVLRQYLLPGYPEILRVSNIVENGKPIGLGDAGSLWHSDLSYTAEPSMGSLLHALELPGEGGDTSFATATTAYEALPDDVRRHVEGMNAVHSYTHSYDRYECSKFRPPLSQAQKDEVPDVVHPVVRTHPETGRRSLFVNEAFTKRILGLPESESHDLLRYLFSHCGNASLVYRHRWQDHDLVFWDNRSTIHIAHGCRPELRRHMHRTTIKGDKPYLLR